ncbi:MAG TPA: hypothetical protein VMS55_00415 [Myxococcota bacterium]|nr:hypothetical protein [Myxococcota bacterium]
MRKLGAWIALLLLAGLGCGSVSPLAAPDTGSVVVDSDSAFALLRRVRGFYLRLAERRFNSLETYRDFITRSHFRTPELFLDYYADLAEALGNAHFEQERPDEVEIESFLFEDSLTAQVQVRFRGEDSRPLRPGHVDLLRVDRWEWADGTWWIRPGRVSETLPVVPVH